MIGILIVAHGTLGESFIQCAIHVLGERPTQLQQLGVTMHDDLNVVTQRARELVEQLDHGQGVLVLSDIYGATPCNVVCGLLIPGKVEGLAGVNLPMLIRALTYREETLETLVAKARSGGYDGVVYITPEVCSVKTKRTNHK
mgnify:FL=1